MEIDKSIIELTTGGVEIKLKKVRNKYHILVSEEKKKIKDKKVFESLDDEISTKEFFKICRYFTNNIKKL